MRRRLALPLAVALLAACGKPAEDKPRSGPPPTLITVTQVVRGEFEVVEETLGTLEAPIDPKIAAEVAGRVTQVSARAGQPVRKGDLLAVIDPGDVRLQNRADEAEVRRLEAFAEQQGRLLERQRALVAQGFLSKNAGDDIAAQHAATVAQLDAARARAEASRRNLGKTEVRAPVDAVIDTQIVSAGDYVKVGDPLFQTVAAKKLTAHLPFPESAAARLKTGMAVRLTSPAAPGRVYESRIRELRPAIVEGSRSLVALADIDNDGALRAGGTVDAAVVVAAKATALTVPEQSVVLRPAGKVVYVIEAEGEQKKARQKAVRTGARRGGRVEVTEGLSGDETIAVDGAGFLTDNATVAVKEPAKLSRGNTPAAPVK